MEDRILVLDNPIQDYSWGSRTVIAELLGRPSPASRPEAELWIGAHPKAPSRVSEPAGLGALDALIAREPVSILGHDVCERFGPELPFLLKILAAAEPLSIQAHPDREQARRGWARENAEGIPKDAPRRNYRDANHKPELVCALSPFVALKGFRPCEEIAERLAPALRPELSDELARVALERSPAALRQLLARLLTLTGDEQARVLRRAAARPVHDPAWAWAARLLEKYPTDLGVFAPLYLNLVELAPGEALYLPAGELHAYLEGSALELMASSDNVLRGGLTPKHVDVPELLATLAFTPRPPEILSARTSEPGTRVYTTPAREFELALLDLPPEREFRPSQPRGVEVLLGLEGDARIRAEGASQPLGRGRSVLVPDACPSYRLEGVGRVARARVPR